MRAGMAFFTRYCEEIFSNFVVPGVTFMLSAVVCVSVLRSLGLGRAYAEALLKIYDYGNKLITEKHKTQENSVEEESEITAVDGEEHQVSGSWKEARNDQDFKLADCLDFIKAGMEAIIEDQVTPRFEEEELKSWNLLTRTLRSNEFIGWKITFLWLIGVIIRYCLLLPIRIIILNLAVIWLTFCNTMVGTVPEGPIKRWLNYYLSSHCMTFLASSLSPITTFHNIENRPKQGICVANHTSPIDTCLLMSDNCYSLIAQRHGGLLGILQRAMSRSSPHIWFEREALKDREAVKHNLKQHMSVPYNPPILIFPEGTCVNNTCVMQFKKGSFEIEGVIYPIAIKYDPRFGDAFWNSSRHTYIQYLYMMMTSWAIVCDVWYLPPIYREQGESPIDFSNRVKRAIAKQGGLVDLKWDGRLKRMKPKEEWKKKQQQEFSKRFKVE